MDILQTAIAKEGSLSNLARALGLPISRVGNWPQRGTPDGWRTVLQDRYGTPAQRQGKLARQAVKSGSKRGV